MLENLALSAMLLCVIWFCIMLTAGMTKMVYDLCFGDLR